MTLLRDPASPGRLSWTNLAAMSGRLAALALFAGGQLDWPWLEKLAGNPELWATALLLVSEIGFGLRRAIGSIERRLQTPRSPVA